MACIPAQKKSVSGVYIARSGIYERPFVTSKLQCRNQSPVRLAVWGPVISTSLDPTRSIWLASNCNRRRFFLLFIYRCSIQVVCRLLTEPARGDEIGRVLYYICCEVKSHLVPSQAPWDLYMVRKLKREGENTPNVEGKL
jgi:hypothetical protein